DAHLAEALDVRQAVEQKDALDQLVGVLHLADRFLVDLLVEALVAPVPAHPRVQEVLVDRGELPGEDLVEKIDDAAVAFHGRTPSCGCRANVSRRGAWDRGPLRRVRQRRSSPGGATSMVTHTSTPSRPSLCAPVP